jgi:hypothetical protein
MVHLFTCLGFGFVLTSSPNPSFSLFPHTIDNVDSLQHKLDFIFEWGFSTNSQFISSTLLSLFEGVLILLFFSLLNVLFQGKKQGLLHAQGNLAIDTKKRFQTFYFVLDFATLWYYNKEHLPEDVRLLLLIRFNNNNNNNNNNNSLIFVFIQNLLIGFDYNRTKVCCIGFDLNSKMIL